MRIFYLQKIYAKLKNPLKPTPKAGFFNHRSTPCFSLKRAKTVLGGFTLKFIFFVTKGLAQPDSFFMFLLFL